MPPIKMDPKQIRDPQHRVLRFVLKVGDLEESVHIFRDLLEMKVLSHEEFEDGSSDGADVHYEGRWSRTILGFKDPDEDQMCIQVTFNHGIEKYERGNHIYAIEIEVASVNMLEEAGYTKVENRGHDIYFVNCNGYPLHVLKSTDGKNRISRVIFNSREPIYLSGAPVRFWTECLKFEVVGWAIKQSEVPEDDVQYHPPCCSIFGCVCFRRVRRHSKFKALQSGEEPYVDLHYGSTKDFVVRLQRLPKGKELDLGTGHERLLLTCKTEELKQITGLVQTVGQLHGGHETKKSFQLVPGRVDIMGVVTHDPNGLEVCYYSDVEDIPVADDIIKRIQSHKGVQGVIVTTKDGTPIRSTMDNTSTVLFVGRLKTLFTIACSSVRDIDPNDGLLFLRIRTSKHEMMLNSNEGQDYMAIVIQNPNEA
ncbi:unnamed protein product [Orchesella dallaii]|uniref:Roadblock/LAMTOR2 domain-containing protein n=1 Tax=Orchesella dallaii TaxID=48710 RepID=A0ABP1QIA5_9HEXA